MTVLEYRSRRARSALIPRTPPDISGHWLTWAFYLGMSWTWCIGMFLPVLIMREFGFAGWIVFAIPNIIGAAAMGWILKNANSSFAVSEAHAPATAAFSCVTIAFHAYFGFWIIAQILEIWSLIFGMLLLIAALMLDRRDDLYARWMAIGLFILSASVLWIGYQQSELPYFYGVENKSNVYSHAGLAAVCVFGFLLCPYLDRTFHHARQRTTPKGGRAAFSIGFGVFFLGMIVLTLFYSGWMNRLLNQSSGAFPKLVWPLIGAHLLLQSVFTVSLHSNALRRDCLLTASFLAGLAVVPALVLTGWWGFELTGEQVYLKFMAFYALVFPAYVWLCMIPSPCSAPSRRSLLVFAVAVIVAAPMFWMGFIEGKMIWLLPGLAIVLLARLAVPGKK